MFTGLQPMTALIHIMSKLVSPDGQILIPGVNDSVQILTQDEKYNSLDYLIKLY